MLFCEAILKSRCLTHAPADERPARRLPRRRPKTESRQSSHGYKSTRYWSSSHSRRLGPANRKYLWRLQPDVRRAGHIASGMEWLSEGVDRYGVEHPPLARVAAALGLYIIGLRSHRELGMWEDGAVSYRSVRLLMKSPWIASRSSNRWLTARLRCQPSAVTCSVVFSAIVWRPPNQLPKLISQRSHHYERCEQKLEGNVFPYRPPRRKPSLRSLSVYWEDCC
jgi:hypothetical protein